MTRKTIDCVVMFADVAGSTAMYENMGDDMARERISKSLDKLIAITTSHSGNLVKTIGDEILVYFTEVDKALYAAMAIQESMEDDRSPETIGVSIRIGMQFGSTILEDGDIYGDTVNVAARIAGLAAARQILCTREMSFLIKNIELANRMRPFDHLRVKGRTEQLDIYLFHWEDDKDVTNMATASSFTNPARYDLAQDLKLSHHDVQCSLGVGTTAFFMGRNQDCDMVVRGKLISRYHSKVEYRRGKFIITDQSTNGTFVMTHEGRAVFLRREELTLFGNGLISLGRKIDRSDENLVQFQCE
ncbi:MAG: FHA domain-containing protein [Gammaproteobacteria bacterium]|nr:FHA domain-containing protein [Gammaproteobacteria bacterium]